MFEIGGFLDIELRKQNNCHSEAIALNTCRNALRYYIRCLQIHTIYVSFFTCGVVVDTLKQEGVNVVFFRLNYDLFPLGLPESLEKGAAILYTNYWGICNNLVNSLIQKFGENLIVDAAQAFYYKPPTGIVSMNSVRKFFGVPDGAYLYGIKNILEIPATESYNAFKHLLKRYELGAEKSYADYLAAEKVVDALNIAKMSKLTEGLLGVSNINLVAKVRRANFEYLHQHLSSMNVLKVGSIYCDDCVPMVYPFKTKFKNIRKYLILHGVYVATYWPNVLEWCEESDIEYDFARNTIPLPIDQRYNKEDMDLIISLIREYDEEE